MQDQISEENHLDILSELYENKEWEKLYEYIEDVPIVEVADFLRDFSEEELISFIKPFSKEKKGWLFTQFDQEKLYELFKYLSYKDFAGIFSHISSDVRADFYQQLDKEEQTSLLPFLGKKTRENVIALSAYPPETAGGIMITDFATVLYDMNVREAIEKIRLDAPSKKMLYYVYVVDENMQLLGFITLKDLILADPEDFIKEEINDNFIYSLVDEDRESVARKIEKYDLIAVPVVNYANQLVGIVSHDDAMDVIRAEHTEDLERFMGIVHTKDDLNYLEIHPFQHFKKRIVWILGLAFVGIISGLILHSFEGTLERLIILALYLPMIADTGGNAGSQSATVVVRALALGHVTLKNWISIIFKEASIAFLLAMCLGIVAFGKVLVLSWNTILPPEHNLFKLAFVISFALSLQVISSTVIGAGLPLIVKRFGGDPAVAASPAITTVVDITGLLIYFGLVTAFFF